MGMHGGVRQDDCRGVIFYDFSPDLYDPLLLRKEPNLIPVLNLASQHILHMNLHLLDSAASTWQYPPCRLDLGQSQIPFGLACPCCFAQDEAHRAQAAEPMEHLFLGISSGFPSCGHRLHDSITLCISEPITHHRKPTHTVGFLDGCTFHLSVACSCTVSVASCVSDPSQG